MTPLGPYAFRLSAGVIDGYCSITGLSPDPVPAALVMRVLTEPLVMAHLRDAFGPRVPIHVSQSVTLDKGLVAEETYSVTLEVTVPRAETLRITAMLMTPEGQVAARLVSDFLLAEPSDAVVA